MDVSSQAHVVREIPAGVILIVVNHDLIGVPEPVGAETEVGVSRMEIKTVEEERGAPGEGATRALGEAASRSVRARRVCRDDSGDRSDRNRGRPTYSWRRRAARQGAPAGR